MGYKAPRTYVLSGNYTSSANPNDSTTYFIGNINNGIATSLGVRKIVIPIKGMIRAAVVYMYALTATGSAEDWLMEIRANGATDYPIETLGASTAERVWNNTNLNIPVNEGDYIAIKTTTPAWVTNPEGIQGTWWVLVEYE